MGTFFFTRLAVFVVLLLVPLLASPISGMLSCAAAGEEACKVARSGKLIQEKVQMKKTIKSELVDEADDEDDPYSATHWSQHSAIEDELVEKHAARARKVHRGGDAGFSL